MEGFSLRDYIVAATIIIGVLTAWFLIIAGLMGIANRQLSFALTILIIIICYVVIKRGKRPPKTK